MCAVVVIGTGLGSFIFGMLVGITMERLDRE